MTALLIKVIDLVGEKKILGKLIYIELVNFC